MTRQYNDERRKAQIRAAAVRCFMRRGFAATRIADIAEEAGLSKGGIYFHYKAKDELFHDILDEQLRMLEARWTFEPTAKLAPAEALQRIVVAHLRTVEDHRDETRLQHLLLSLAPLESGFREKLEESVRLMRNLYTRVVARGIEEGAFLRRAPEVVAASILGMIQGLAMQSAADPDGCLPIEPEEVAASVLRMIATTQHHVSASKTSSS